MSVEDNDQKTTVGVQLPEEIKGEINATSETEVLFEEETKTTDVEEIPAAISEPKTDADESVKFVNAIQTDKFSLGESPKSASYMVSLPSYSLLDFNYKINKLSKENHQHRTEELKEWREVAEEAVDYYTVGGLYQNRFSDKDSVFKQGIETKDGSLLSISTPKFKTTSGEIKGELALLKISKALGLGDVINIPLPHSGIWVTIKPPTEKDLIDFYNSIYREKVSLGRSTFGLTLSNFSVQINNRLFDFILKHIHNLNYGDMPIPELKNYLLIHDFPILAWGFACTMYPNGFDYQRNCITDINECSYVAKEIMNMTKLLWVDNPQLSEYQKVILEEFRPNKLSLDGYRKFISEHKKVVGSTFTTKRGIKIRLKIPTFAEYTSDGLKWVNGINTAIENIILAEDDNSKTEEVKTEMLNQYVKTSVLRQFNHFVDYIDTTDGVVTDRETINQMLEMLSGDDELRSEITENILKFKANTTIGLVGIPEYECPSCHAGQNTSPVNDRFINVIPLDVMNLFFTLITLKISRILEREV